MKTDKPNPGSKESGAAGCTCPVIDNCHGRGWMGGVRDPESDEIIFVVNLDCPIHGDGLK